MYNNYIPEKYRIPFEAVAEFEPMYYSCIECLKGVMWKSSTQTFHSDILIWASNLSRDLLCGNYRSKGFTHFKILERGKIRDIHAVHISERAVQKSLVANLLRPIIYPKLISANCATLPGRGTEYALNRLHEDLRRHLAIHGNKGGILTLDYHAYYDSVVHDLLIQMLSNIIWDPRALELSIYFINAFANMDASSKKGYNYKSLSDVEIAMHAKNEDEEYDLEHFGSRGLGLGSEISQITAIYYPTDLDHYIKEQLKIKGYSRYMDDSYLIHEDLNYLIYCRDIIYDLSAKKGLSFNPKKSIITPFSSNNSFIFLKKHYHITDTNKIIVELSDEAIHKHRQQLYTQNELLNNGKMTPKEIYNSFMCWRQSVKNFDSRWSLRTLTNIFINLFGKYMNKDQMKKLNKI